MAKFVKKEAGKNPVTDLDKKAGGEKEAAPEKKHRSAKDVRSKLYGSKE